jgi:hypothetical protein
MQARYGVQGLYYNMSINKVFVNVFKGNTS